ncbi:MAG: YdeI/OmpD-associated family protein [Planctomycetota bacterium]
MPEKDFSKLKRQRYPIPEFVKKALIKGDLMEAYKNRPPYQQNDYIGWITRAKRDETKEKRLNQMLDELKSNDRYMNMKYQARDR